MSTDLHPPGPDQPRPADPYADPAAHANAGPYAAPYAAPHAGTYAGTHGSQTMARWALGLSLAFVVPGAFVVGAALAVGVLVGGRPGVDHGRGKAVAALAVSAFLLLVNAAVLVVLALDLGEPERDDAGRVTQGGAVSLDRLQVGDCFSQTVIDDLAGDDEPGDDGALETAARADVVPCTEPHQAEVFHEVVLTGADHPGEAAIDARAEECVDAFEEFVGLPYGRSVLEFSYFFPTTDSWRLGDRKITCSITNPDAAPLTGTTQGSRR